MKNYISLEKLKPLNLSPRIIPPSITPMKAIYCVGDTLTHGSHNSLIARELADGSADRKSEVWAYFWLKVPSVAYAILPEAGYIGSYFDIYDSGGGVFPPFSVFASLAFSKPDTDIIWALTADSSPVPAPSPNMYHLIEFHYRRYIDFDVGIKVAQELFVGGNSVWSTDFNPPDGSNWKFSAASFGIHIGSGVFDDDPFGSQNICSIGDFRLGTTRGGTDYYSYDLSSGLPPFDHYGDYGPAIGGSVYGHGYEGNVIVVDDTR